MYSLQSLFQPHCIRTVSYTHLDVYKRQFTDCSVGYAYDKSDLHIFSKIIRQIYKKIISFLENHYDSYILFSEQMNEIVNKQQKPFCVMEGFFNPYGLDLSIEEKFEKKILLYAGSLIENFGIEKIIKAFNKINDPEYELWIAGDGPYRQELQKLSTNNSNIKFLGYVCLLYTSRCV